MPFTGHVPIYIYIRDPIYIYSLFPHQVRKSRGKHSILPLSGSYLVNLFLCIKLPL